MTADTAALWSSTLYSIVLHPTEPLILAAQDGECWTLPRLDIPERVWPHHVQTIGPLLADAVGMRVTILRCAAVRVETATAQVTVTYVLDSHGTPTAPQGMRWLGRTECARLRLPLHDQYAVIEESVAEAEGVSPPAGRPPWMRQGWWALVARWIAAVMGARGTPLNAPLEQIKVSGATCVLRAPLEGGGAAYFKQSLPVALAADEPRLMMALATRYPGHVPAPLAGCLIRLVGEEKGSPQ